MARSKAVFSGREPEMGRFGPRTKKVLRGIARQFDRTKSMRAQGWPAPEKDFVGAVLTEAEFLRTEYGYIWNGSRDPLAPAKKEARQTCVALRRALERVLRDLRSPPANKRIRRTLRAAESNLRQLPANVDRELGIDADPLGAADEIRDVSVALVLGEKPQSTIALASKIDSLLVRVKVAEERIALWPKSQSWNSQLRAACVETALRVLRVLREWDVPTTAHATDSSDSRSDERTSVAVRVMLAIASNFSALPHGRDTWRQIVGEALKSDDILQKSAGRQKRGHRRT